MAAEYTKITEMEFMTIRGRNDWNPVQAGSYSGMHWRKLVSTHPDGPTLFWQWRDDWEKPSFFRK